MALNYRRGSAAIQDAATSKGGGDFRPFLPQIVWKNDGDSKYVLVLTDIADVAELLLHSFIPVGRGTKGNGEEFIRYEEFLSRKDPCLAEEYDDLEDRLEREPKTRCMGVMVELVPVYEAGSSKKLKGFTVKTDTFTRNTDDGEVEITTPVIGLCTQSSFLLWGRIDAFYHSLGDLTQIPLEITRRGEKTKTQYDIIPLVEKPVDLDPIMNYLDGITYIGEDIEKVIGAVEDAEGDVAKAQAIADFLLTKRIDELGDAERYEELVGPLELDDMPKNSWGRKAPAKNQGSRPARPPRRSPREVEEPATEAEPEPATPSKNERFAALKSRVEGRG